MWEGGSISISILIPRYRHRHTTFHPELHTLFVLANMAPSTGDGRLEPLGPAHFSLGLLLDDALGIYIFSNRFE